MVAPPSELPPLAIPILVARRIHNGPAGAQTPLAENSHLGPTAAAKCYIQRVSPVTRLTHVRVAL